MIEHIYDTENGEPARLKINAAIDIVNGQAAAIAGAVSTHNADVNAHASIREAIDAEAAARASEDEGLNDAIEDEQARAEEAEALLTPKAKLTAVLTGATFSSDATSVELTFSVYNASLDTSSDSVLTVPLVSGDNPGMMPAETYSALTQALADILALQQQGGKYIGQSFATKAALNAYEFTGNDNPGDFTFVLDDETQNDATTRYIISGTKTPTDTRAWSFGYVINYDPTGLATTAAAGLVKGTAATDGNEGKTFVETDGTMSVIGWDSIVTAVGTLSGLTTTAKSSLVAAINEVKSRLDEKFNNIGTIIPANTDLNNYTAAGHYRVHLNDNAAAIANMPVQLAGILVVDSISGNGSFVNQIFIPYKSYSPFRREYNTDAGSWNSWEKFAMTSDIPASLPANGGNADTVGGYNAIGLVTKSDYFERSRTYLIKTIRKSVVNNNLGCSILLNYANYDMYPRYIFLSFASYSGSLRMGMYVLHNSINEYFPAFQVYDDGDNFNLYLINKSYVDYMSLLQLDNGIVLSPIEQEVEGTLIWNNDYKIIIFKTDMPTIFTGSTPPTSGFKDGDIFIKIS